MTALAYRRQHGATLIISLILLLIITLLAISSMREVSLEERVVGNLRDSRTAFNGAESGLREGETRLAEHVGPPATTADCGAAGPSDLCVLTEPVASVPSNDWDWWIAAANARAYEGSTANTTALARIASPPRWYVAFLGFDPANSLGNVEVSDTEERSKGVGPYYYQVNAASQGRSTRMMTTLQSAAVQRY